MEQLDQQDYCEQQHTAASSSFAIFQNHVAAFIHDLLLP
jgi:hypothetical protein